MTDKIPEGATPKAMEPETAIAKVPTAEEEKHIEQTHELCNQIQKVHMYSVITLELYQT